MSRPRSQEVEEQVLRLARSDPELGQFSVAARLQEGGWRISASGVRSIWKRHNLETLVKRLKVVRREGGDAARKLTENQAARLSRANRRRQLHRGETDGRRAVEPADRMQLLLDIAAREFHRRGYKGASLKDIGAQAGLLPGSLYHYIRSKEDLLRKVHHAGFLELNANLDLALADLRDPLERFRAACRAHLELLLCGRALAAFTGTTLFVPDNRMLEKQMLRDRRDYEERFRELIGALPRAAPMDRGLLRLALFGAMNWTQIWYKPGKMTPTQIADQLVALFVPRPGIA
jgi:AcrR family transcriptional regulator